MRDRRFIMDREYSHYQIPVYKGEVVLDIYDILDRFNITSPPVQHAVKKLLVAGERGVKDTILDLQEARSSITRAIQQETLKEELYEGSTSN